MLTKNLVLPVVVIPYPSADLDFAPRRVGGGPVMGAESVSRMMSFVYIYTADAYSKHACTRPRSTSTSAQVGARTIQRIFALSGITTRKSW